MGWDNTPPTAEELASVTGKSWDSEPPSASELAAAGVQRQEPTLHKFIREGLPMVGTYGGGALAGALATPETLGAAAIPAAMAGAAVGNAAGSEAAGWLNHAIYGDEAPTYNSVADAKRLGINAAVGAGSELGGQLIGKGVSAAANSALIKPYLESAGNAVVNAGKALGPSTVSKEVGTGLMDAAGNPLMKTVTERGPNLIEGLVDKAAKKAGEVAGPLASGAVRQSAHSLAPVSIAANGISQVLQKSPGFFGKWAPALASAAARGELALNANVYVLQQQDPEFRQKMEELNNTPQMTQQDGTRGSSER